MLVGDELFWPTDGNYMYQYQLFWDHSYQVRGTGSRYAVLHFLYYYDKDFFIVNLVCNTWYDEFNTRYVGLMKEPINYVWDYYHDG